jgi:hypothetical protein
LCILKLVLQSEPRTGRKSFGTLVSDVSRCELLRPKSDTVFAGGELTGDTDLHFDELNTYDILWATLLLWW